MISRDARRKIQFMIRAENHKRTQPLLDLYDAHAGPGIQGMADVLRRRQDSREADRFISKMRRELRKLKERVN